MINLSKAISRFCRTIGISFQQRKNNTPICLGSLFLTVLALGCGVSIYPWLATAQATFESPTVVVARATPVDELPIATLKTVEETVSAELDAIKKEQEGEVGLFAPDIQRIKDRGKLIVAMVKMDVPPFIQSDSPETPCTKNHLSISIQAAPEKLCGFDVESAVAIATALDVDLEFDRSATTFNGVVDLVYAHQADLAISKLSRTLSRGQKVLYTDPYIIMRQGLLMSRVKLLRQSKYLDPLQVIRGLSGDVGVIQDTSYAKWLPEKFPNARVKEYPQWDDAIAALIDGELVGVYRDELEVKRLVKTRPNVALELQTVALTDTRDALAMITAHDSPHLLAFLNQYLSLIHI